MGFQPGQPRPPNAGRKKGSKNKKPPLFVEIMQAKNFDTLSRLIDLIEHGDLKDRDKAMLLAELLQYEYPKRKAVEITGDPNNPIAIEMTERARVVANDVTALELAKQLEDRINADDAILASESGLDGSAIDITPV